MPALKNHAGWFSHAPAKLNFSLRVLERRPDGFHEIETLLVPIRLYDTLLLRPTSDRPGSILLNCVNAVDPGSLRERLLDVPAGESNLIVRALQLLWRRARIRAGAEATLIKRIPTQAGLGGGSSDAAAALTLGNRIWDLGLSPRSLSELGAELGSDIPALLNPGPSLCKGRGEIVTPTPRFSPLACVIVKPPVGLSTKEVYAHWQGRDSPRSMRQLIQSLSSGRRDKLNEAMQNQLQWPAETLSPWIGRLRDLFAGLPFLAHQMTGSGSAYFGICHSVRLAQRLAAWLRHQRVGWVTATSTC